MVKKFNYTDKQKITYGESFMLMITIQFILSKILGFQLNLVLEGTQVIQNPIGNIFSQNTSNSPHTTLYPGISIN